MKHFEYEDRLTKKKNQKEIEKKICESLGFDLKTTSLINEGKYQIKDDVMIHNAIDKLGQLEDIEERLGIKLSTLIKAVDDGIYSKEYNEMRKVDLIRLELVPGYPVTKYEYTFEGLCLYDDDLEECYEFKDYGKTWALTKKEIKK